MSKGSRQRTVNSQKFNDNYDRIFGVRDDDTGIPRIKEEKCADRKAVKSKGKG